MAVLVTGGAGYIGSHTCVELIAAGFQVVVLDNFCNSKPEALRRVEELVGQTIPHYQADITDREALRAVFKQENIDSVIHFAGLKAVGESCEKPLAYYHNNVGGTVALCQVMEEFEVDKLLFSSSATVYGDPASVPITEDFPTGAVTNPYGRSKFMVEELLQDLCRGAGQPWKVSLLRYFNPIGAHISGRIGEDPQGIPNNLLPFVAQVAVGKLPRLRVFGGDYNTPDGTGVRDYIHVVDLARGHVRALEKLMADEPGCYTYNLGTGRGYSVLDVIKAFEQASGKAVPYDIDKRRPGDIAQCYADPHKAGEQLGWRAEFDLDRMVEDTWRWQSGNPHGYGD
jgi:UDP-glucose 4-epimerase